MTVGYPDRRRLLEALGLHRPELRAWALYDPASAVALDVVVTAVFPIHFATVVAADLPPGAAAGRFALLTTVALSALALLAPVLGALADRRRSRRRMMALFVAIGAPAVALLGIAERGDVRFASILFLIANVGTAGAGQFHGALLRHVARDDELDRTSTTACALGYLAAGAVLLLLVVALERPSWLGLSGGGGASAVRAAFVVAAAWWVALSVPLLGSDVEGRDARGGSATAAPPREGLGRAVRALREHPQALLFAAASLLYGCGIGTITRMAVVYGSDIGLGAGTLLLAVIVTDLVGTPFAFLFGAVAGRIGAKRAIQIGLAGYVVAALLAATAHGAAGFFAAAVLIASVQGGAQALSRSLFASLLPAQRSAEFFGLMELAGRLTGMIGPALFAVVAAGTGSSRSAILSVVVFFAAGAAVLAAVDVDAGQRAVRERAATEGTAPAALEL
jgi:UMF1 family MFS transporter